ncbi:hypothetical protein BDN67DRAFT_577113 [Paxillus ammoniavirescens]|nr:hypothetical protein BDN67DRAFT_577113 [Paxillus ammoniavirescens]
MVSLPSKPSQLRVAKGPVHRRLPSSEYLPVPRHVPGSQQSSPLLEEPTLSDKALISDNRGYVCSSPRAMRTQKRKSLLSGISSLNWICYVLHALLIILHSVLLGMLLTGVDHRISISPLKANFYSVLLTVMQQTFFTVYQGALVVITQQLALRSNLRRRQTLTALHDKSVAWGGLGASILSLWRQVSVPTAVHGTLCVVLYLVSISILHVSSSSLIDVETYDTNVPSKVRTILGLPNMTAVEAEYDDESWDNAGAVASALGQLPASFNHGLVNSTIYDILLETTGVGNTTLNATTFTAKCYSAGQVYNSLSEDPIVTIDWGGVNASFDAIPLYEDTLWFMGSLLQDVQGRLLTFLSFPPIPDSNGALGTTFPVAGTIYGQSRDNFTVEIEIQAITCSLSYTTQGAIIDSQTNALLGVSPRADDPPVVWTPITNLSYELDPVVDWFSSPWFASSPTIVVSPSTQCSNGPYDCAMSLLNLRLSSMLALEIDPNSYVIDGQGGNITNIEKSNTTLSELEEMLSAIAAQLIWTVGHINITDPSPVSDFIHRSSEAEIFKIVLSSRLHFNLVPVSALWFSLTTSTDITQVSVGLGMSVVLFVLAYVLTSDAARAEDTFTPDNMGMLQLLWLFSRQPGIRESLYDVSEPSEDQLRKAGLVDVQAIDDDEMIDPEPKSF